ncbi:ATP-binding cassette domain-containing protein [Gordonibacter massiliensis (ex Traore et al. 2017)]|uniref:ATP-binding cassette domain-containing protein n=1 Tax=Gordonibacter massiliensis (ex Traore et al. 2017) TaxID=1841863 RepID=A0A842JDT8_9ACTN|nr:ATP-binding cassette domain-containing protein [Gordonibacter massiliensis (ex Traore et al. 2017)]MBC2889086.1 ATP-binding cassette domain-containing protein [Gordonibacter massiliensis (ex Traore et al. 2017)]
MQETQQPTARLAPSAPIGARTASGEQAQGRPESGTFVREGVELVGEPYISARGLGLKTFAGYAYHDVDVDVHKGELVAVRGRNGSGKTALLLTLAGRMKQSEGTLTVGGFELPRQRSKVARHVGLSLFKGVNDLQDSLTAASAAGAELELYGRKARHDAVLDYLRAWGLADVATIRVKDLTSEKLTQLGIALAFAGEPDAVVVDDVEDQLTMMQSEGLVNLLLDAARTRGVAIVMGVVERDLAAMADACVYLSKEGE